MVAAATPGDTESDAAPIRTALAELRRRLGAVSEVATGEVAAAREQMIAVAELAGRHGSALETVAVQFRGDRSARRDGIPQLLVAQSTRTSTFLARTHGRLTAAREATRDSLRMAGEIREVVRGVAKVSFDAALLALNAQIAAANIGPLGAGAAVISARMRTLAREIASANEALGAIAGEILVALPTIDASVGHTAERADEYVRDAKQLQDGIEHAYKSLQEEIETVSANGRPRAALIAREAREILRLLDGHDEVIPLLQQVDDGAALLCDADAPCEPPAYELGAWCADAAPRIERAIQHSLTHIAPVVSALTSLNERARVYVDELAAVCSRIDPDADGERGHDAQLATLVGTLASFVEGIGGGIREQASTIVAAQGRGLALTQTISQAQDFALEAAIIGITTKIESARLQEHGQAFREIGVRMKELNGALGESLDRGQRLSRAIDAALSGMLAAVTENQRAVAAFSQEQSASLEDYRRASARVTNAAREAVAASRDRADQMLQHCFQAIVHFQFQDRITQELASTAALTKAIAHLAACDDAGARAEAVRAIDAIPTFIKDEGCSDAGANGDLASGDMMLF